MVYTDQKSLQFLIKFNDDASAKLVRWQASLLAYDFDIFYKAGTMNVHADAICVVFLLKYPMGQN